MSLYLNLGAGRVAFPLIEGQEPYGQHLKPLPPEVYLPGWVNVDKFNNPGIQAVVDLFRFPWVTLDGDTFAESNADAIYAGHIIEHVPHQCRLFSGALSPDVRSRYENMVDNYDGFFLFMYECWRILKPGGLIYVRAPFAYSTPALADPTHTRYLVPGSFGYLSGQDDATAAPFDYHLPMRFELVESPLMRYTAMFTAQMGQMTEQQINEIPYQITNAVDEFRITLRAIKK